MSCMFHSDTVPHALPRFHNPLEKATMQPPTLCVDLAAHEPGRCCQDGTSCDVMTSCDTTIYHVIVIQ